MTEACFLEVYWVASSDQDFEIEESRGQILNTSHPTHRVTHKPVLSFGCDETSEYCTRNCKDRGEQEYYRFFQGSINLDIQI